MNRLVKRFLTLVVVTLCVVCTNESNAAVFKSQAPDIPGFEEKIADAMDKGTPENPVVVSIPQGVYRLDSEHAIVEDAFISNTESANPKRIGLTLRGLKNAVVDFNGSTVL